MLRLRQIALVAHRLQPVVDDLRSVLGIEVAYRDPGVAVFGLENAVLPVGNQFLEVVSPVRPDAPARRYLERRGGDGGYMVILQCDDLAARRRRIDQLGVRVAFEHEAADGHRLTQLHPKDTGGSFLEVDQPHGPQAEQADGPWAPAGPGWKPARRLDVVTGIAAAEIQGPDPDRLAARWAELLERGVERDAGGRCTLVLDNAVVRFLQPTDDRGEGLAAVELTAVDRQRIEATARRRGCVDPRGDVIIGGVRIRAANPPGT
jgi:hypothetical protein